MAIFQHKYNKVCPAGAVINFAIQALNDARGRPVACVLMNVAEVTIFHHEVSLATAFPEDKLAIVAGPESFWADRDGKLWLMTYAQLSAVLSASPGRLEKDLTLLLHMGCGQYTWDIVKACHDMWEWARSQEVGMGKPIVWVYTISNLEESIYCDAAVSSLSTEGVKAPRVEWLRPEAFGAPLVRVRQEDAAHEELCKSMEESQKSDPDDELLKSMHEPQQFPEQTNRAVVFTSKGKLLDAYNRYSCPPAEFVQLSGNMTGVDLSEWVEILLQREFDIKMLLVEPDVGTIGTVRNLGTVLVLPVMEGLFFDRRVSQVVLRKDIPMSQAEVRYAYRVACSPRESSDSHTVSVFTTKARFGNLPPAPTDPLAFTGDFPAVLLHFCEHSYFDGGDKTSPIRLPKDKEMTNEYLRRLELRGLTESRGGPLTYLGRLTSWWQQRGVRNFDVANLLAIASTAQGARASALVRIAAVIYHPSSPLMSPISSLMNFLIPDGRSAEFYSLLQEEEDVLGFARSYVERGPIWLAVALWAGQGKHRTPEALATAVDFSTCDGMLQVSPKALSHIESNWLIMSQEWTNGMGGVQIDQKPRISEEDFLFLEECIVRVWMHNLVLVAMDDPGRGVWACDLTSGSPVARPDKDPVNWARLAEEVDSEPPEGEPYTGVFAIYTSLTRSTGPDDGVQYVPEDLTFVSTRAVRRVLRDVAVSKGREGYRLPSWHDLLRTRYPISHNPDDP